MPTATLQTAALGVEKPLTGAIDPYTLVSAGRGGHGAAMAQAMTRNWLWEVKMAMAIRIIVGLVLVLAVVGASPMAVPGGIVPLALVVLGLAYAALAIDAEDATAYLVVVVAVGAAEAANVLSNIPAIGGLLDGIVDQVSIALYAGVITVLVVRTFNRLKG